MTTRMIEGGLVVPQGARFGIGASRFNHFIVDRLVEGAIDALVKGWDAAVTAAPMVALRRALDDAGL
jgi:6,7-dimethyl-8-ribityllumazine synthase